MPRRVKVPTLEMGELQLLLLNGWEHEWGVLEGTPYGDLISQMPWAPVEHVLNGYSRPLVDALGIPPEGALRKVPQDERECYWRVKRSGRDRPCSLFDKHQCFPTAKAMPWCFEPTVEDVLVRQMAAQLIELWREGVYVVVVQGGY